MEQEMKRLCIYPKDVQFITGRTLQHGQAVLRRIRKRLKKERHQVITVDEFCDYLGLDKTVVKEKLKL